MRRAEWKATAVVLLFFAALWAPLIGMLFGVGNFEPEEENRSFGAPPQGGRQFTAYIHDHFGFRGTLITAQALFKVRVLGVSSSNEVLLGRDGWLFYAGDKSVENHRGVRPYTRDELTRWVNLFKRRGDWLAERGIHMIVAIPPDKISVYPEFLPASFGKVKQQTRLDEFLAEMRSASHVPVLDLRQAMLRAKVQGSRLYHPTDTHWTAEGAYTGYLSILAELSKTYPEVRPVPFRQAPRGRLGAGDLVKMLGLARVWRDVPDEQPWPPELHVRGRVEEELVVQHEGNAERRLMLFGDSFAFALVPYLAQDFGETIIFRSSELNLGAIAGRHPNIVLIEMVERKLNLAAPEDR
ncbi:MAG: hypothetical protein M3Z32_02050 [Acidobacteriota bacterium]|nr:hypothetical protein [Acidobacteriota bacterium]